MVWLEMFSKLKLRMIRRRSPIISFLQIKGKINYQTTMMVGQVLNRIPKTTKKLAVVINSQGGQMSQAYIIRQRLKLKAKNMNIQLLTYGQQFAINSAFYLLTSGDRVYADRTTVLGGLQVGLYKYNLGQLSNYINTVVYAQNSSYIAELKKDQPFSQVKAAQMKQLLNKFSEDMKNSIIQNRKQKIKNPLELDLSKLYYGQQALKLGLIDGIGRIHQATTSFQPNMRVQLIQQNTLKKALQRISNTTFKL